MTSVVELADFRPSPRHDGQAWTRVRVDETDDPTEGAWTETETIDLDPVDLDATAPALRSITVTKAEKAWVRLVFLFEEQEDQPCPFAAVASPQFIPLLPAIGSILRARTYNTSTDELVGGELVGEFNETTRPTKAEIEGKLIPQAARDVATTVGRVPGELFEEARRIAALRVAAEIERAYIPEQASETHTLYQTLRMTYDEELAKLASTIQWWVLAKQQGTAAGVARPWFW
jgi:hypothetical protein